MNPLIALGSSLILAYVFITAARHKWRTPGEFADILQNYQVLPGPAVHPASRLLPVLECATGLALLVPAAMRQAADVAAALLLIYSAAITLNLVRGRRRIDCGCGGTALRQTLSEWLLARNAILIGLAVAAASSAPEGEMGWHAWTIAALAAATACLFYETGNQLLANRDRLRSLELNGG